jgi:dTDP-4-amino-4,6-dideoxygalactose transaminase
MNKIIPLCKPDIRQNDIENVIRVIKSGMLVQGKEVQALEGSVSAITGTKYCSAVSNGTASLQLALLALGIGKGDKVIVPAFSYIATANVVELVGAECVFVDIEIDSFNIDYKSIENIVDDDIKAIIPVHEFGLCANMPKITEISNKYDLFVIEDAACALGAAINGKKAGSFGHFGSFSLHPRKAVTSGEGGLLVTDHESLLLEIQKLRNHGIMPNTNPSDFVIPGFNYRLTDIQASLVNSQLERFDETLEKKHKYAQIYLNKIVNPLIKLPTVPTGYTHTWQTFHIMLDSEQLRDELSSYLKENGVLTNYGAQCIPYMSYFQNKYRLPVKESFPNAYKAYKCGLALPLYEGLTEGDIYFITELINKFKNNG